jgi:hypothetical protein
MVSCSHSKLVELNQVHSNTIQSQNLNFVMLSFGTKNSSAK